MSAKFVSSGSINTDDVSKQRQEEIEATEEYLQEKNQDERKSLLDQLKQNRTRRYNEYKSKLESQNSSYRMSAKDVEYYSQLEKAEREKEEREIKELEDELKKFKEKKQSQARSQDTLLTTEKKTQTLEAPEIPDIRKRKVINLAASRLHKRIKKEDNDKDSVEQDEQHLPNEVVKRNTEVTPEISSSGVDSHGYDKHDKEKEECKVSLEKSTKDTKEVVLVGVCGYESSSDEE